MAAITKKGSLNSPAAGRTALVSFPGSSSSAESPSTSPKMARGGKGSSQTFSKDAAASSDVVAGDDDLMAPGRSLPRKSFLLKDVLKKQPTAYQPKYVSHKATLPQQRWVKPDGATRWRPVDNRDATVPSLVIPGYEQHAQQIQNPSLLLSDFVGHDETPHFGDMEASTYSNSNFESLRAATTTPQSSIGGRGTPHRRGSETPTGSLGGRSSPRTRRQPNSRQLPRPAVAVSLAPSLIQSTPLDNGVQTAWCSSHVQLGPFRNLKIFRHVDHELPVPIEVLPAEHIRLTPLEQRRVQHAQREYMRVRTPTITRGHVCSTIAEVTHIGLVNDGPEVRSASTALLMSVLSSSKSPRSPRRGSPCGSNSSSGSSDLNEPAKNPPMHFALPPIAVLTPPPFPLKRYLPPRPDPLNNGACQHRRPPAMSSSDSLRDPKDANLSTNDASGTATSSFRCTLCNEVVDALDAFDDVRESKEDRLYQHQLQLWMEQQAREEEAKTIPPDMMRTKSGRLVKKLIILDEGPTVAQLYHGTKHDDREALYVSTCGGLSFDITKERFRDMIQKVLAPRIHVRVTDDQVTTMFSHFDLDADGVVSYFEYLSALTQQMLTPQQTKFLDDVFDHLYKMPFLVGDSKSASKQLQQHHAQMMLEGQHPHHLLPDTATPTGQLDAANTSENALLRRKSLVASPSSLSMQRRKSKLGGHRNSSIFGDDSLLGDSFLNGGGGSSKKGPSTPVKPLLYLSNRHISVDRLKKVIYDIKQHNPWFPHPKDDALAVAIAKCFRLLTDDDRVVEQKFKMFIFCDDPCMEALEELVPSQ